MQIDLITEAYLHGSLHLFFRWVFYHIKSFSKVLLKLVKKQKQKKTTLYEVKMSFQFDQNGPMSEEKVRALSRSPQKKLRRCEGIFLVPE